MSGSTPNVLTDYIEKQDKTVRTYQSGDNITSDVLSGKGEIWATERENLNRLYGTVKRKCGVVDGHTLESQHEEIVGIVRQGGPLP